MGPWLPNIFAPPDPESPFMVKKASPGKKFEDFLGEKASPAQTNQRFSEEISALLWKFFFGPPISKSYHPP